jgi:hypothetical protein
MRGLALCTTDHLSRQTRTLDGQPLCFVHRFSRLREIARTGHSVPRSTRVRDGVLPMVLRPVSEAA